MKRSLWGFVLILVGVLAMVQMTGVANLGLSFWPVVLTVAGLSIIYGSFRRVQWFGLALGLYLSGMGIFEILNDAGYTYIDGGDIAANGWPILLVAIGVSMIFGKKHWWQHGLVIKGDRPVIGDVRYGLGSWTLDKDLCVDHGIGDVKLDLTMATISDGVHHVTAKAGIGDVAIRVPDNVTVYAEGRVGIGELEVLGDRRSGMGCTLYKEHIVPGSTVELRIHANLGLGDLRVIQQPARTVRIDG